MAVGEGAQQSLSHSLANEYNQQMDRPMLTLRVSLRNDLDIAKYSSTQVSQVSTAPDASKPGKDNSFCGKPTENLQQILANTGQAVVLSSTNFTR